MLDEKYLICDDGENDMQIDLSASGRHWKTFCLPPLNVSMVLTESFLLNPSQDFLGQAFCTLGEIFGSLGCRLEKPLR